MTRVQSELSQAQTALESSDTDLQEYTALKADLAAAESRLNELQQLLQESQEQCQQLETTNE